MKQIFFYMHCVHVHNMKEGWDGNEKCVYVWFLGLCVFLRGREFLFF